MRERRITMNELKIFEKTEFGQIRTVTINDKVYFVASDVAKALGYKNDRDAINRHCRWVVKYDIPHPQSINKTLEVNVIPQGDIVRLASNSELPGAEKFESWIYDEVIPTVLNYGMYAVNELLDNPDLAIKAFTALKEEREKNKELRADNKRMKPKEIFADAVSASHTSILIGDLAKLLKQNGYETGQKRLFQQLRQEGYLIKGGSSKNMPTQKSMEMELFEVKETSISNPDGSIRVTKTTKVTGKGQQYFINHYLAPSSKQAS